MARLAVLASGNGSNFQAIAETVRMSGHCVAGLLTDRKDAFALERARNLGIPSYVVGYSGKSRRAAEEEMVEILKEIGTDLVALAGFMRVLTPYFIDSFPDRIVNIHPSLLPAYPGTHSIERSFMAGDRSMGITIHRVDYGTDTGPVILQKSVERHPEDTLPMMEEAVHRLEHRYYPEVLLELLDAMGGTGAKPG